MSKKKRKFNYVEQKRKKREREILILEAELKELKSEKIKRIIKNLKNAGIRNLKIYKHSVNFLLPYAVVAGLTIGSFKLFNGGLPFNRDDVIKFNRTDLDYQTEERINLTDYYVEKHWYDEEGIPDSTLKIFFPYQYINDSYTRIIRTYDVKCSEDLINAVLNNDIDKIEELLPKYDEETEYRNKIDSLCDNAEVIAEIHFLDKTKTIRYPESVFKNNIITIIESLITLIVASIIAYNRKFNLSEAIKEEKEKYPKESLESINEAIKSNKQRTRVLRKTVR